MYIINEPKNTNTTQNKDEGFKWIKMFILLQLRDEFDSGKDVRLDESYNCHDIGALLKEYFRDLPEALLTRDLYSAFVATRSKSQIWHFRFSLEFLLDDPWLINEELDFCS